MPSSRDPIDEARRTSFDRAAAAYDAARPSYPEAIGELLAARVTGRRALEIGAGTGLCTALLARHGFAVTALEPGGNLAAVLRAKAIANVAVAVSTFEAWQPGDARFDLVASAQAIHWIDPAVRYTRPADLLRPGGALAVIRNETTWPDAALRAELDVAYARWTEPGERLSLDQIEHGYVAEIDASARYGAVEVVRVPWQRRYTTAGYLALLDTYSDHAVRDTATRAGLGSAIAKAIDRRGGSIDMAYVALVFLAFRA